MTLGRLAELPRTTFATQPTGFEKLGHLSRVNTGATIWAKRDDLQGLAFGGNKVRQLEYYFGEAEAQGADTVLITGAVQSNFCRLATAFAAKLGMACHVQLEERVPSNDPLYRGSGNVLLDQLMGATLHSYPAGEDEAGADAALEELASDLRAKGAKPYVIHLAPGHPPLGAFGYVHCAEEMLEQIGTHGLNPAGLVVASGSGATHAGVLFGLRALGSDLPVYGICVRRAGSLQKPRLQKRCEDMADILGIANPVTLDDILVNDRFLGPGYGKINLPVERAIRLAARTEAMIVDPVYTGKTMAGALNLAGTLPPDQDVIFLHTGGTPGIFAYAGLLEGAIAG